MTPPAASPPPESCLRKGCDQERTKMAAPTVGRCPHSAPSEQRRVTLNSPSPDPKYRPSDHQRPLQTFKAGVEGPAAASGGLSGGARRPLCRRTAAPGTSQGRETVGPATPHTSTGPRREAPRVT